MCSLAQLSVKCHVWCWGNTCLCLVSGLMCINTVLKQQVVVLKGSDVVRSSFEKVRNDLNVDVASRWLRCVEASLWKTCHLNKQRVGRNLFEVRGMIEFFIRSILCSL